MAFSRESSTIIDSATFLFRCTLIACAIIPITQAKSLASIGLGSYDAPGTKNYVSYTYTFDKHVGQEPFSGVDEPITIDFGTQTLFFKKLNNDVHGSTSTHWLTFEGRPNRPLDPGSPTPPFPFYGVVWTLTPNVDIQPQCNPVPNIPCGKLVAATKIDALKERVVPPNPPNPPGPPFSFQVNKFVPAGFLVASSPPLIGWEVEASPQGLDSEVMRLYGFDYFLENLGPGLAPKLKAGFALGPKTNQGFYYDLEFSLGNTSCILTASSPNCDQLFLDNLANHLIDPSFWEYDITAQAYVARSDISLPLVTVKYLGASAVDYHNVVLTPKNIALKTTDAEVPGSLPIFGVGAAFGYSRKLRKRIKNSKTPEVMSAIG